MVLQKVNSIKGSSVELVDTNDQECVRSLDVYDQ